MNQEVKSGSGMATASLVLGIIAFVLGLAPLLSGWFLLLVWLVWILAILSVIFGIIGLCKSQSVGKCVAGLVLSVLSIATPYVFPEKFAENAMNVASDVVGYASSLEDME